MYNTTNTSGYVPFVPGPTWGERVECPFLNCVGSNILVWTLLHLYWLLVVSRMILPRTYIRERLSRIRTQKPKILRLLATYSHVWKVYKMVQSQPETFWIKLGQLRATVCTWVGHLDDQIWFQHTNGWKRQVTYPVYQFLTKECPVFFGQTYEYELYESSGQDIIANNLCTWSIV